MTKDGASQKQVKERYFYTKDTPHKYSSGPALYYSYTDEDGFFVGIEDIHKARELANAARKGKWGDQNYVRTTYGVLFEEDE